MVRSRRAITWVVRPRSRYVLPVSARVRDSKNKRSQERLVRIDGEVRWGKCTNAPPSNRRGTMQNRRRVGDRRDSHDRRRGLRSVDVSRTPPWEEQRSQHLTRYL